MDATQETRALNLDLIGVHEHENKETQEKFMGLSFRLAGNRIGTMNVNDPDTCAKISAKFDELGEKGERLVFAATNASLAVATELAEDGQTQIPLVRKGTPYFRIVEADVANPVSLKLTGTRAKGASVSIEL